MSQALVLAGWGVLVGGFAAALARHALNGRSEAVARACHELRGPLTALRLGLELAARAGQLAEAPLRAIELELGRASLALEDLAQVRQPGGFRGGRHLISADAFDLVGLLGDSVLAWQGAAVAAGAELRLHALKPCVLVRGERLRLAQAVANLLANAVEHGGGLIEVRCRADGDVVRIEVEDGGRGLPSPLHELTRRDGLRLALSWRLGKSRQAAGANRGHGLRVVTAVAEAHGGRLSAAPTRRGAHMVLELPVAHL